MGVGQAEAAGCPAGYPVRARTQEALSLDALAVKSRYPHTRVSPYESVASTPAHTNCTHFRPVDCLRPAKALLRAAPPAGFEPATRRLEDVGTESARVPPCRHRSVDQDFHRTRDRSARGKLHTDLHTSSGSNRPRPAACGNVWGRHPPTKGTPSQLRGRLDGGPVDQPYQGPRKDVEARLCLRRFQLDPSRPSDQEGGPSRRTPLLRSA